MAFFRAFAKLRDVLALLRSAVVIFREIMKRSVRNKKSADGVRVGVNGEGRGGKGRREEGITADTSHLFTQK